MKKLFLLFTVSFFAVQISAFANENEESQEVISCTLEAEQLLESDFVSLVRNKSGFETGALSFIAKNVEQYQNSILLKKFDEEKNRVSYRSTKVGEVVNKQTLQRIFVIDQCDATFDATDCKLVANICQGI